jgi:hypothetical protein
MSGPSNSWTPQRRESQAKAIHRWKPWEKSTGPRSVAGKAAAARNSRKHGACSKQAIIERRLIHELIFKLDDCSDRSNSASSLEASDRAN